MAALKPINARCADPECETQAVAGGFCRTHQWKRPGTELAKDESAATSAVSIRGMKAADDFAEIMKSLLADVIAGKIEARQAEAACAVADRMLRAVELKLKYEA